MLFFRTFSVTDPARKSSLQPQARVLSFPALPHASHPDASGKFFARFNYGEHNFGRRAMGR